MARVFVGVIASGLAAACVGAQQKAAAGSAAGSAPVGAACFRPAKGSVIAEPEDLRSENGVLQAELVFRRYRDASGAVRCGICYVAKLGGVAPNLRLHPGDTLILRLKNEAISDRLANPGTAMAMPMAGAGLLLLWQLRRAYYTVGMKPSKLIANAVELAKPYCVMRGSKFRMKDYDPGDTNGVKSKKHAEKLLAESSETVSNMQELLYAQDCWALLLIFQGMDAAGKDGAIKHVMSGVNPEGCDVFAFKEPSAEELKHDFLWRCHKVVPGRGKIGIFNRSYYEEVLIVRVHPQILAGQKLPKELVSKHIWDERYEDINAFERFLARNGVLIRKFFLHVSKKEQEERFLERLDDDKKNWKFSLDDAKERGYWKDYKEAYEEAIQKTASKYAPWYIVPADHKWFARLVVASAIVEALSTLDLAFPKVDRKKKEELAEIRAKLVKGG